MGGRRETTAQAVLRSGRRRPPRHNERARRRGSRGSSHRWHAASSSSSPAEVSGQAASIRRRGKPGNKMGRRVHRQAACGQPRRRCDGDHPARPRTPRRRPQRRQTAPDAFPSLPRSGRTRPVQHSPLRRPTTPSGATERPREKRRVTPAASPADDQGARALLRL